jgi:hypothetical protein
MPERKREPNRPGQRSRHFGRLAVGGKHLKMAL